MKVRISATIDKGTRDNLTSLVKSGVFRNKSHVIERAIDSLRNEISGTQKNSLNFSRALKKEIKL